MFTWICPQCGREVPPAYTECPNCAKAAESAAAAAPPAAVAKEPPAEVAAAPASSTAPPPVAVPPSQPAAPRYAAQYTARPRAGMPTWLLTILSAFAFIGLGAAVYWTVGYYRSNHRASTSPPPTVESPAAKPGTKTNPLQKYIEISGVRFTQDAKKRVMVKFSLTNHSDADLTGLAGNVTMWGRTQSSEEDAVGTFSFTTNVGPQASQELTAPLTTKLKIYELPDWQNVTADLQVTAPQ